MLHPTRVLQIPIKSWVTRLAKRAKKHPKMNKKTVWERRRKNYGFWCCLGLILWGFWEHFGDQKPSENRSRFWDAFSWLDPTSGGLRGDFKGTLAHAFPPQIPPGRRPFRARRDHITASGSQQRDPTRHGPEARRIHATSFLALVC